jgi:aspartate/methionine/tyrosine aminotransferase
LKKGVPVKDTPINSDVVDQLIEESEISHVGRASIRELVALVNKIESATGEKYVRMEMGVPGLRPPRVGVEAEIAALRRGVGSVYPNIEGVWELKKETARFVNLFMNIDVAPEGCFPTVGNMQGVMACFMVLNRTDKNKEGTLFLDPGFPVQKLQAKILGHSYESFDLVKYRGEKLRDKLESYLKTGKISTILYSNPNNPTWMCLAEEELRIIGDLANAYDVIVIEDLAYFGMDFRKDISEPGVPPYQSTVARYTDNYVILISGSKAFSYAGQRTGLMVISNTIQHRRYPDLKRYFTTDRVGYAMVYGVLYTLSAGTSHSAQYGLAAILKAANDGEYDFIGDVRVYGERAALLKKLFKRNGFKIEYDKDLTEPIADGFFFTISYPGFSGEGLLERLLHYGISAMALYNTGADKTGGLRACVSQISEDQFDVLEDRLKKFQQHHTQLPGGLKDV